MPYAARGQVPAFILVLTACVTAAYGTFSHAQATSDMTQAAVTSAIDGVAAYRERIALPPGARFEATLEDVSRADAPSVVIGRTVVADPRTPIRFSIAYDPAAIAPERTYAVRAQVRVNGQLWFTSNRIHQVLTRGAGRSVEIPLQRVRGAGETPADGQPADVAATPAHGLRLPATFRGDLPCADCAGVRHHLDLWPDQVFHLRREWLGKGTVHADVGRWRVDAGRRALVLQGGTEMPLQFEILGADRLRALGLDGKPIASALPYELTSDDELDPGDVALLLGGEMTYLADSARFTECLTGRSYAILPGDETARLQRAYLADVRQSGRALYVTFEGTLTRRPGMDGDRLEPAVTVERFIGTWPNQACDRSRADAALVNTYWRIVRLRGESISATSGRREPHVVLKSVDGQASYAATVGCNQLIGPFESSGERIAFKHAATTRMACPPPLAELERRLGDVLDSARQWQIRGSTLELKDATGAPVALLEAVYF